jgi:flagellar M-ring protein FliF
LKDVERLIESAAGIDAKRGDRITVSAVEFLQGSQPLESDASSGIAHQLVGQLGSIVNALAVVGVAALLIWFGLRPAVKAILVAKASEPAVAAQIEVQPQPTVAAPGANAVASDAQPNLIADLTEKLGRTPLKRLEQMVDYDEDQAAAILKQWMREAERA